LNATIFRALFLKDILGGYRSLKVGYDLDLWRRVHETMKKLSKEGYYFKLRDDLRFLEFKHVRGKDFSLKGHFKKMIWYGTGKVVMYKEGLISLRDLLAPFYLSIIPIIITLAFSNALICLFLLIPFILLFSYSILRTFSKGFRGKYLIVALSFPFLMIFKALGLTYEIIKEVYFRWTK